MDTLIFIMLLLVGYTIISDKPPQKILMFWGLTLFVVVCLMRVHITSSLGLGLTW